jgi:hypothetical protein
MGHDKHQQSAIEDILDELQVTTFDKTVHEMVMESPMFKHIIENCTEEDKERAIKMIEASAKEYDKLIDIIKKNIKTPEDVEKLLTAMESTPKG